MEAKLKLFTCKHFLFENSNGNINILQFSERPENYAYKLIALIIIQIIYL